MDATELYFVFYHYIIISITHSLPKPVPPSPRCSPASPRTTRVTVATSSPLVSSSPGTRLRLGRINRRSAQWRTLSKCDPGRGNRRPMDTVSAAGSRPSPSRNIFDHQGRFVSLHPTYRLCDTNRHSPGPTLSRRLRFRACRDR